jgi:hypothetical protein
MANVLTQEAITVEQVGKFGVRTGEVWYGVNEPIKPESFTVGTTYTVAISTSSTGKKYIKEVLAGNNSGQQIQNPVNVAPQTVKPAFKKSFTPYAKKADNGLSKEEWAQKDRNQMIGGRSHDAAELVKASVNSGRPMNEILALYQEALEGIIRIADTVK